MKVEVKNWSNKVVGEVELPDQVFAREVNGHLVWEVVRAYLASRQRGTHKAKERSEVAGTRTKPWKQKHTGRARAGSRQSPLWRSGGDRGLYRTTDGGSNWDQVLFVDEKTGAADLEMDPGNPDKLIAAMWEYRRWPFSRSLPPEPKARMPGRPTIRKAPKNCWRKPGTPTVLA